MRRRRRMADRSKCKRCAELGIDTPLSKENAYSRNDTYNKLHVYCKSCYLILQRERNSDILEKGKKYTTLVRNGSYKPTRVYFDSVEEKKEFISGRKSQSRWYRSNDSGPSNIDGCTALQGDQEFCDECGGVMRYDKRGLLACERCGLVAEGVPFYREQIHNMLKGRHAWSGTLADSQVVDVYYNKGYG
jgi:hypothetical protein